MKLAVTGASGFVGSAVVRRALAQGHAVRALVRGTGHRLPPNAETIETGDLLRAPLTGGELDGCDALINCAARVHVTRETASDPDAAYRAMNSDLPVRLLRIAARSGVKRFVQMSSVAAVTSRTPPGTIVDDRFDPAPQTPYGRSKLEADLRLAEEGALLAVPVVSIRPPTIFGPGVGAYFRMLMRCAKLVLPLPIGGIANSRSFMFLGNLADATLCAAAADVSGSFIVTDSAPLSTADLYRALLRLYRRPAIVPRLPGGFVHGVASLFLGERVESLLGDSAFDGARFAALSQWTPPTDFSRALTLTVEKVDEALV